ncbi:MAG: site-specific integrase [Gemmataceae bacterium]|nr:site-specific integrase [Gemmataceae bacterium]
MATIRKRGKKWSIVESYRDGGKVKKRFVALGVTDKRAAEALLHQWEMDRDRGKAGILDTRRDHLDRSARGWLDAYLGDLSGRGRSAEYVAEVGRVLGGLVGYVGADPRIRDVTAQRVREYLSSLTSSAATKNKARTYAVGWFGFLSGDDDRPYESNPITKHTVPTYKSADRPPARRRYRLAELPLLLDAVERYPLVSRTVNRGGRPKADGSPAQPRKPVDLSDGYRAELERLGRERRLIYRTALLTGLRRGELGRILVRDVYLTGKTPRIDTSKTKNGRRAVFRLTPSLAADLDAWVRESGRRPADKLFQVPSTGNLSRIHRAALRLAGITHTDERGIPVGFHSLRRTLNVFLAERGVSIRDRMRAMRHRGQDITTKHYDDDHPTTMTRQVFTLVAELDRLVSAPPAAPGGDTPAA